MILPALSHPLTPIASLALIPITSTTYTPRTAAEHTLPPTLPNTNTLFLMFRVPYPLPPTIGPPAIPTPFPSPGHLWVNNTNSNSTEEETKTQEH